MLRWYYVRDEDDGYEIDMHDLYSPEDITFMIEEGVCYNPDLSIAERLTADKRIFEVKNPPVCTL